MIEIEQAFVSDFVSQAFGLPIAHENVKYTQTPGTEYAEIKTFPAEVVAGDLGSTDETTGFFQFVLRYEEGKGAMPAKLKAQTIFDAYPVGRVLTYGGQRLTLTSHQRPTAAPEDGWFKVVGRIYYRATVAR